MDAVSRSDRSLRIMRRFLDRSRGHVNLTRSQSEQITHQQMCRLTNRRSIAWQFLCFIDLLWQLPLTTEFIPSSGSTALRPKLTHPFFHRLTTPTPPLIPLQVRALDIDEIMGYNRTKIGACGSQKRSLAMRLDLTRVWRSVGQWLSGSWGDQTGRCSKRCSFLKPDTLETSSHLFWLVEVILSSSRVEELLGEAGAHVDRRGQDLL